MNTPGPRIAPLHREHWQEEERAALRAAVSAEVADAFLSGGSEAAHIPNAFATIVRNPSLAKTFFAYNRVLLWQGALTPRHRELVVLRVAWRTQCAYEWAQHVQLAQRLGIAMTDIAATASDTAPYGWTALESTMLAATDQLIDRVSVDDETWTALAKQLDEAKLIELAFIVGTYVCVAMVLNSLGVELDPDLDGIPGLPPKERPGRRLPQDSPDARG